MAITAIEAAQRAWDTMMLERALIEGMKHPTPAEAQKIIGRLKAEEKSVLGLVQYMDAPNPTVKEHVQIFIRGEFRRLREMVAKK